MPGWLHDLFSLNGGLQAAGARAYRPRRCCCAPAKLAGIQSTSREGGGREGARASPRNRPPPHRTPPRPKLASPALRLTENPPEYSAAAAAVPSPKWTRAPRSSSALSAATAAFAAAGSWGLLVGEHRLPLPRPPATRKLEALISTLAALLWPRWRGAAQPAERSWLAQARGSGHSACVPKAEPDAAACGRLPAHGLSVEVRRT